MNTFFTHCSTRLFAGFQKRATTSTSFTKQLVLQLAVILFTVSSYAQITNLRFSNEATTYVPITGGTTLVGAGSAAGTPSGVFNIGFTFKFQGVDYTQFSANAAGLLKLGSVAVTNEGGATDNTAVSTFNTPKIYALWDKFLTGNSASGGGVTYLLTGTAPNRALTVQWKVGYGTNVATTTNFQVKLYESTNVIEFYYGAAPALTGASVGLGGLDAANDYLSVFTQNSAVTNAVNFNANTVIPGAGTGHKYTFTPTEALTSTPACLTDAPNLWLKADTGVNYTRTLLNVPAANRTASSFYTQTPNYTAANSTLTGVYGWMPSMAEGANSTPASGVALGAINLDLGSVQAIDGVATLGSGAAAYYTTDYTVKVSNDNVTWTNLGMFQGNEVATELHYADFDAPVTCRYVRVIPGGFKTYRAIRLDVYTKSAAAAPANNTKVTVWEDLSGNNWDASQPTTVANEPVYLTNQFNFNPALNFAAASKLDIPDYNISVRYAVNAPAVGAVPSVVTGIYSPIIQHAAITGPQVMAENISYRYPITATQESIVKSYLATKYGITLAQDYVAADGTTKTFDLTANAGYTNNIFGIGRADCQDLHQRQSKSSNLDGLITIGNNNTIDFTNGNTSTAGNNIATDSSYLLLGDNGGPLELNTSTIVDTNKLIVNRIWKLQETGTIGSVKISVPAFGNTSATATLPLLTGTLMSANPTVYVVVDSDTNLGNGGTTYYPMTAVGSGATLTYEANVDLTSAAPYVRFAVGIADTDADTTFDILDIDADNDGILNAVESPSCFYTALEMSQFDAVSSELTQYSTWVITNAIEPSGSGSAFATGQNWVGKEIFNFTAKNYVATTGLTLDLISWALSPTAASTFKLQGSINGVSWTDLSTPVASTLATGSFTVNNTLAPTTKFKYFRLIGVAGTCSYGGVTYVSLNVPSTYNPSVSPKPSCTSDTDADGIPNHLDLDSDGDACPDAYEAGITGTLTTGTVVNLTTGSTTATTATPAVANAIAAGPYNANGLVDALQTTGNGLYSGIYSYNYAINAKYNLCADLDGDGVKDINDIDDDNDGILDHIESPACFFSKAEMTKPVSITSDLTQYSTNLIGYAIDNDPVTKSAFSPNLNWVDQEIFNFVAAGSTKITGVTLDLVSWALSTNATSTFKLQGSQDNYYWKDLSTPVASIATTGSFTVSNTLLPNTPFKYFRIIGVAGTCSYGGVTDLRINVPATFNSSAYPKEICTNDTDTDGKLNHQDVNSDGDSCFDGIEAGALPVTNTTGIVPGTAFGLNGFADALETVAESGIFKKAYAYDYATNATISNCTDTDGDGLLNVVDIDDDNDGVLDADEAPTCYMTFQEWNNANKTEFVKITSDLNTLAPNTNFAALTDNTTTAAVQFVTATTQTQYNKELFRATFAQPIQLDAFYIKKTGATQIFNSSAASLMVQGSNDPNNGTWTNLLTAAIASPLDGTNVTVNGSVSLTNSNKFTIAANAGKYKYYRIYGVTDVDIVNGVAAEFYFDVNRTAYIPSSFPKAICTTDTDADGIINTLDLDSDGDGCADAVEATANRAATSTSVYPTGTDANANGLLDNYEGTPAGTTAYFSTYTNYALVNTIDSCLDTDLDVIPDSIDIDDDNDGVLDADEQINCAYPQKDLTALTFNGNANGVFTATDLTLAATVGSSWGTKYSDQKLKLPIHLEYTSNTAVNHGMFGLFPVAKTKTPTDWADGAYKVYHNGSNIYGSTPPITGWSFTQPYAVNDLIEMDINTAGVVTIRQNGWVIRSFKGTKSDYNLAFSSYTNAKVFQNIKLTSYSPIDMVCTDVDTDGDGVVNRLDIDSDGDGCNDAVEAGAATVSVAIPFVGAVGTNGLIDSKEVVADTGDINYTSTYGSYGMSTGFNACLDTDVDGIGDLMDIDDDNDGLTDDIEQGCSSPLFANKTSTYTAATKTGLMTGTVLKETGNIDYELKMTGPSIAFTPANYDSGNGLHFLVGDGGKLNINLNFKLTSTAFEASPVPTAPKVKYVDFGPNVPVNTVPSQPINEIQNITLDWPGAYGVVYDPFNQLSSHNTGDIIESGELIEQNVNISAADVTAKKTWTVRMFMHTNADVYVINANIYGDPTIAQQSYGFNLAACSSFDTDTDGVINELDLDSDEDGCSDAFEGGTTTDTTASFKFANGTVGTNGLTSTLEVADTISTAINYTTSYNIALSSVLNKCLDTDLDTVNNVIDIDDDNDGILDSEEMNCGSADFSMANLTTTPAATSNLQNLSGKLFKGSAYADYEINMVGVKTVYTSPGTAENSFDNSKGGLHYFLTDDDNIYSQTFRILPSAPTSLNKVQFGVNTPFNQFSPTSNSNDAQSITLTWNPDVKGVIYDPNDQLSTHATGDVITSGTVITTRANYTTAVASWRIDFMTSGSSEQFFLQTSHKSTSSSNFSIEAFGINADLCFSDDTDGDGTPDYLDSDSDGDGCGDAFEAGASLTPGGATQTVAGPFGANGFANALENVDTQLAQINYTTTAYMAYSPVSACADTDSDTIPDRDDIDDDNDGILDTDEYSCAVGKFVKTYLLPSGLGMGYSGTFNTASANATGTINFANLNALNSATDLTNASSYLVNDGNGAYTMRATFAPTNGMLSEIVFGPNLVGNTNTATSNAQQSITLTWSLPIGATVYDPDDQLSSHATGDAINPGGVLVTRAAYTVAESTWKIVLPLPFISREVVINASFSSATNFAQESFGFALNVCNKAYDLDGDGKGNAIDTDSDGDGCFDLVESKSHKNTTLTQEIIGGTFGTNGLSSLVETNDTNQAGINYTLINDFLDKNTKGCTDTDGDNVPDVDDIDDDNDGILDKTECPTAVPVKAFTFTSVGNGFYVNDKATGVRVGKVSIKNIKNINAGGLIPNVNDYSVNGTLADGASTNTADRVMQIIFEPVAPYQSLALKVLANEGGNGNWYFHPRSLRVDGGIAGNGVIKAIPQRYYLKEKYNVGDVITPSMKMSTAFKGALGPETNKVFIQVQYGATATAAKPLILTYTWNAIASTFAMENFGFQLMDMAPSMSDGTCDYDHDGINDDLDSDSDNDGCPDTKEAVHGKPYATTNKYIKGPYGANGFSTLMETNDTFAATYSTSSWLPKVTTTPKSDYINELVNTRCIIPFIVPAGPIAFCAPGSTVLNINLNGGTAPVSYQWEKDGVAITGATSSSYTATETGDYTCTLTYADTSTITTDPQDITANPAPTAPVVTASPGTTVCLGTPATLTSSYTTGNQWYYNTNSIVGATAVTYAASASGDYKVEYTDPLTGCKNFSTTTVVVIGAVPATPTVVLTQPTCSTTTGTITVTPSGNAGDTYTVTGTSPVVAAATNDTGIFSGLASGTYTVVTTNANGCSSAAETVVINAALIVPATPAITAGSGLAICAGGATTLTSSASTGNQWYKDGSIIAGATTATFTAAFAGSYTVQTTSTDGCSATSPATVVTVSPSPTASLTQSTVLSSSNCGTASPILLTASTDATGATYAWYKDGVVIGGATASTYTALQTGSYTVVVTSAAGCPTTSAPSSVTTGPSASAGSPASICAGQNFTFTATVTGFTSPTFAWEYSANGTSGWATPSTGVTNAVNYLATTAGFYRVIVSDSTPQTVTSCPTELKVNALPTATIGASPAGALCAGQTTTLTATAAATSPATIASYQWLDGSTNIAGATTATYATGIASSYAVLVTDSNGCQATAAPATVAVNALPAAPTSTITQPTCATATGTITVTAPVGSGYTYTVTGTNPVVAAVTNGTGIFSGLATGTYSVKATVNGCEGPSTTEVINAQPTTLSITGTISGNATPLLGGSETYTITAVPGAISYIWTLPNGSWIGTSTSNTIIATPAAMTGNTGTITVKAVSADGCESAPVSLTVAVKPAAPTVVAAAYCQNATATALTATADAGGTLNWYTTSTGSVVPSSLTPSTTTAGTTSYFVSQTVNGVESDRAEIIVTVNTIPAQPGTISGATSVVSGSIEDYSIAAVSGADSYVWTLPSGTTGNSTAAAIRATYGSTAGSITVKAVSAAGCESPLKTMAITIKPAAPIVAPLVYCQFTPTAPLSVTPVSGATLNWYTVATGGTVSSTVPTPSRSVVGTTSYFVSQTLGGIESDRSEITVTINSVPAKPGVITGTTAVVIGATEVYTIAAVAGATSYTWTLPNGWTGTSTTETISATVGSLAGNIKVTANANGCPSPAATFGLQPPLDSDGDGVSDDDEAIDGTDPYNPCDYNPAKQFIENTSATWQSNDCDGDGLTNKEEKTGIDNPATPGNPNGKITDPLNVDTDGDGVTDAQEAIDGTDPTNPCAFKLTSQTVATSAAWKAADCDADGLTNQEEKTGIDDPSTPANPNGKLTDPLNVDTDGDGVTDAQEAIDGTDPTNPCAFKSASQTVATSTAWNNADCDGDGLTNGEEKTGIDNPSTPANPNGKITDPLNVDTDGDGVTDAQEAIDGTDPTNPCAFKLSSQTVATSTAWNNADCDGDGLTNQEEKTGIDDPSTPANPNGKITDPLNVDTDGDGVTDAQEAIDGTDPTNPCAFKLTSQTVATSTAWNNADCDADGLTNQEEKTGIDNPSTPANPNGKITDPLNVDTDGDGVTDAQEAIDGTDPTNPCAFVLTSQTVATSTAWNNADCDNDGESNAVEKTKGTDPKDPCSYTSAPIASSTAFAAWSALDCDGDGETNGFEYGKGTDPMDACSNTTPPAASSPAYATWAALDCDGDGETNGFEKTNGTDPNNSCSFTVAPTTAYALLDCDGDGTPNGVDPAPLDPCVHLAGAIPNTNSTVWAAADCDGDGETNGFENSHGTDPNNPCSYTTAPLASSPAFAAWSILDCDGDGTPNGTDTAPLNPCVHLPGATPVVTNPIWAAADCDGDGETNGFENTKGTDPNDACSFTTMPSTSSAVFATWSAIDCDGDGLTNKEELTGIDDPLTPANPNGKITDPMNVDTDGDGVTDAQEAIDGTDPTNPCAFKLTSQTVATSAAWNNADCDADGLTNQEEKTGIDNPSTPANPNGKITDPLKVDTDGDGVTDAQEAIDGTDPTNPCAFVLANQTVATSTAWKAADCDADGLTNQEEKTGIDDPSTPANPNGKITDPLNVDTDGDGVTDAQEAIDGTDPIDPCAFKLSSQTVDTSGAWNTADCDGDGLTNGEEKTGIDNPSTPANPYGKITDPLNVDTDGDGVTDGQEALDGTDPTNPCAFKLVSQTLTPSNAWKAADCDADGLTNQEEKTGIDDPSTPANPNGKITNPLNVDTDGDGVTDGQEAIDGTDPTDPCAFKLTSQTLTPSAAWKSADCDGDGLTNEEEKTGIDNPATPANPNGKITDPLSVDTDGDGVTDSQEALDGTDPTNPCSFKLTSQTVATSAAWKAADCDADGLTNQEEKTGIDDPSTPANPNGKITDPLNKDTDGDGVTDAQEAIDGTDPTNPCAFVLANQTVATSAAWNTADCDGDGESNSLEKTNGTDPLVTCSNSIPFPVPTITSSGSIVCSGTAITLTSSVANGYQWFKNGVEVIGATAQNFIVYDSGSYTVQVLNSLGCLSTLSNAEVTVVSTPPTADISEGAVLAMNSTCNGTPINLTVSTDVTGATYQWTKDGVDIPGATSATYNATVAGLYRVKVSKGGCTTESAATKILPAADASSSVNPTICAGDSVQLSVNTTGYSGTATYQWKKGGAVIVSATAPIYDATQTGVYTVEVTDGATTVSCPITVTVNALPVITIAIAPAATICAGDTSTMTAAVTGSSPFTYKWRTNGIEMNTETATSFGATTSGVYDVRVADANGCEAISASSTIVVNALPTQVVATATSQPTCSIGTGTITVSSPAAIGGMTYSIDGSTYTNTSGIFENIIPGTYTVTAKNANGCVGPSATVVINAQPITPAQPGVISGTLNVLPGTTYVYTISPVTDATSYTWTLPNGWGGTSTTTSISAIVATTGGTITVVANAGACISPASSLVVSIDMTSDTDGDGVLDSKEILDGTDPNDPCEYSVSSITVPTGNAWNDADCDNDGLTNGEETTGIDNPLTPANPTGIITDPSNQDSDGDGVTDGQEAIDGTNPNDACNFLLASQTLTPSNAWKSADCDGDGLTNQEEKTGIDDPSTPANPNGKITDPLNKDSDGDGVTDGQEAIDGTDPNDVCSFKLASQTLTPSNAWKAADCDADGLTNQEEKTGIDDPSTPANPNGKITDPLNKDTDGDGVTDGQEAIDGTDPTNPCAFKLSSQTVAPSNAWKSADCDADGLTNQEEKTGIDDPSTPANPNGKITDPLNKDSDGDGVTDAQEAIDGTDPNDVCSFKLTSQTLTPSNAWKAADCDADGLTNQEEKTGIDDPSTPANPNGKITDPLNKDSDGDGVTDAQEAIDGTNPNDVCSFKLASQTLTPSNAWKAADCDGDGLTNQEEKTGIDDPSTPANPNGKITDPLNKDSDGDGVTDAQEAIDGTNPNDACSFKLTSQTLPTGNAWNNADCDGDGVTNGQEKIDGTNPNNPCDSKPIHVTLPFSSSFLAGDCDGDGLSNGNEIGIIATTPQDIDKNGVPDYLEVTKYTPGSEELEVYNSVSPNGDGDNDTLIIRNIENYPNNTVSIYNRWGVLVFEVDGYGQDKVFRGISEGRVTVQKSEELPEGTYFYILRYANTAGEEKQRSGYLYIKR